MAQIATTIINGVPHVVTKVVNGVRRVSCSCCCFCRNYDLDFLLYGEGTGGLKYDEYSVRMAEECGDIPAWEQLRLDRPDSFRYVPKRACLRWLCRQTVLGVDGPVTISNTVGGPTTNDRDLNDLVLECLGERSGLAGLANGAEEVAPEEYGRCYLYTFDFIGWWKRRFKEGAVVTDPSEFISSDLNYNLWRADSSPPTE